ncbi:hypothetical protein Q5752_000285 [Cryptotrichosporon argae]
MSSSSSITAASPTYPPKTVHPPDSYTLKKRPWRRYVEPFPRLLAHPYKGSGTEADPYIVDWLPTDAENPQAWSPAYKWGQIAVAAVVTLAVALSSSAYTGGIESLMAEFGGSTELWTAGVSLFVVGFAFGPLIWAPASEIFGRRLIYISTYTLLTLWQAVSIASPNIASVIVFRALAGFFGSSPLANAGGTIADILDASQRGLGMALFAAAPFLGPALGPITGGFIGDAGGWKWVEAFLSIFCAVITLILCLLAAETYAPRLLRQRAATLSKATGKVYRFRPDAKQPLHVGKMFTAALIRPWKFLVFEPIVLGLSIYIAIIYGTLYMEFAAYPIVFEELRGWNSGEEGLAFLGLAIGVFLSVVAALTWVNPRYLKTVKARGHALPEDRLPPAIWAGVLVVVGLAGFAATDGANVHWIAPIIFGIPFGLGMVVLFLAVLAYLVDTYTIYAASVLAANSVLRSLFGASFPMFTAYMYENLGIHWAAALPGFLALACLPFPILFYKYGAAIRARCKYAADAQRTMAAIMAARKADADAEKGTAGPAGVEKGAREGAGATDAPPTTGIDKGPQAVPAEQTGGLGKAEEAGFANANANTTATANPNANRSVVDASHPAHPAHPDYAEYSQYEALADRDATDLSDDDRIRLEAMHHKYGRFRAAKSAAA